MTGTFCFEQLATIALAVNLVTYFNGIMHFDIADAANNLTNFMGAMYILTILVAYVADTYIGRWKSVMVSGFLELSVNMLIYS